MKRFAWYAALCIISPAAAGITAWSLYVVAHDHYGVPAFLAALVAAVFDGTALGCLHLASVAVREGRSAVAPLLATFGLAAVSVYLNVVHAQLIHGGLPAGLLFAVPTVALLLLAHLSWGATRARARAERGETPMRLPVYGVWGWALAHSQAWQSTKARAVAHVTADARPAQPEPPVRQRTARAVLTERFREMDPADAIQIAAHSHPALNATELAALLADYGVTVDALTVALVLGQRPDRVTVERAANTPQQPTEGLPKGQTQPALTGAAPSGDAGDAHHDALQVSAGEDVTKTAAIKAAVSALGDAASSADIAAFVREQHSLEVDAPYVRVVLHRAKKAAEKAAEQPGSPPMTDGYL